MKIDVIKNGPLMISGSFTLINGETSEQHEKPVALCRCGHSKNKPFCDGSHYKSQFIG